MRLFLFLLVCLALPPTATAFPWDMFLPAITGCDSYPFPSCRARTLCQAEGRYWYNGQCNQNKHQDQAALEKLDGYWGITFQFNACGYDSWSSGPVFALNKDYIYDDNINIVQLEGNVLAIMETQVPGGPCAGNCDYVPDYLHYAMLAENGSTYVLKELETSWGFSGYCLDKNDAIIEEWDVNIGDTGTYTFDLTTPNLTQGKACFVGANICFDFIGELLYR